MQRFLRIYARGRSSRTRKHFHNAYMRGNFKTENLPCPQRIHRSIDWYCTDVESIYFFQWRSCFCLTRTSRSPKRCSRRGYARFLQNVCSSNSYCISDAFDLNLERNRQSPFSQVCTTVFSLPPPRPPPPPPKATRGTRSCGAPCWGGRPRCTCAREKGTALCRRVSPGAWGLSSWR